MRNKLKIDRKTKTIRVNMDGYAIINIDGSFDMEATLNKFRIDLTEFIRNEQFSINKQLNPKKGSAIAKSGFDSENNIITQFGTNYKLSLTASDIVRQLCNMLSINLDDVEWAKAYLWKTCPLLTEDEKKKKHKTDIIVIIKVQNEELPIVCPISQKRAEIGLNQLDRRWVDSYAIALSIPDDVARLLKFFTGELPPTIYCSAPLNLEDERRIYVSEMIADDQAKILSWFQNNIENLLKFVFVGKPTIYSPTFMLIEKVSDRGLFYKIVKIDDAINLYKGNGKASLSRDGNIYLGSSSSREAVSIKRKGGDGGAKTAQNLQVQFNPILAFDRL